MFRSRSCLSFFEKAEVPTDQEKKLVFVRTYTGKTHSVFVWDFNSLSELAFQSFFKHKETIPELKIDNYFRNLLFTHAGRKLDLSKSFRYYKLGEHCEIHEVPRGFFAFGSDFVRLSYGICPFTQFEIKQPIILSKCGHVFEKDSILKYIENIMNNILCMCDNKISECIKQIS